MVRLSKSSIYCDLQSEADGLPASENAFCSPRIKLS